jgi:hypothetical protein
MVDYKMLGDNDSKFRGYETVNYCEKLITDYGHEEVENYHTCFGKLFKWLTGAIALRKQDIVRRKAITKRDIEFREEKLKETVTRAENRELSLLESAEKWAVDNESAVEAFHRYNRLVESRDKGDELDEASTELLTQDAPVLPVRNVAEVEEKFDTENPVIVIPQPVVVLNDNDWLLTEVECD